MTYIESNPFSDKEAKIPFTSKAQQRFLFAKKPEVAEEFAEETPKSSYKNMPQHVTKDKNHLKKYSKQYGRKKDVR